MRRARIILAAAAAVLGVGLAAPALADPSPSTSPASSTSPSTGPSASPSGSAASDPVSFDASFHPASAHAGDVVELLVFVTRSSGDGADTLAVPMKAAPLTFVDINLDPNALCGETGPPDVMICRIPTEIGQRGVINVYYRVGAVAAPQRFSLPMTATIDGHDSTVTASLSLTPAPSGSPTPPPPHDDWYGIQVSYHPTTVRPGDTVEVIVQVTGLAEAGYVLLDLDSEHLGYRDECIGYHCGEYDLDHPGTFYCGIPRGPKPATCKAWFDVDAAIDVRQVTQPAAFYLDDKPAVATTGKLTVDLGSAAPSASGPAGGAAGGDGLPTTGTSLSLVGGAAAVLLGGGVALLLVARRRRPAPVDGAGSSEDG
ncbi:MAG TPA: hypothetical protein VGN37_05365 [Actinocatenispora sp.]